MKKIISMFMLIAVFAVASVQGQVTPPNSNCPKGHIETPVFVCAPPNQNRDGEVGHGTRNEASDDSIISIITEWFSDLVSSVY